LKDSKPLLAQEFTMTKNGNIEYCLGIQIKQDWACKILFLLQEKYIYDILHKFHIQTCKPIAISLQVIIHYTKHMTPITNKKK
jgi:hypothetical protein